MIFSFMERLILNVIGNLYCTFLFYMGNIYKCKWAKKESRIQDFKIEMGLYFQAWHGLKIKKHWMHIQP